jgi:ferrous iron transport protein A
LRKINAGIALLDIIRIILVVPQPDPAMCPLNELLPGDDATVAAVGGDAPLRQRLAALGLRPGRPLTLVRRGALKGPLHVRLGTTDVILRRRQAHAILVHR